MAGRCAHLIEGASRARYIDGGRLVYQIGSDVFVARFDVRTLVLSEAGRVRAVFSHITCAVVGRYSRRPHLSACGRRGRARLSGCPATAPSNPCRCPLDNYIYPTISPSGDRVAVIVEGDALRSDAWTYDLRYDRG